MGFAIEDLVGKKLKENGWKGETYEREGVLRVCVLCFGIARAGDGELKVVGSSAAMVDGDVLTDPDGGGGEEDGLG